MNISQEMILDLLKAADGQFVSSRAICASLQTSRTAVWKHIRSLQKQGYQIDAVTNKGYRLPNTQLSTDFVNSHEINEQIQTKVLGRQVVYYETIDSTNSSARQLADQGAPEGTLVIADEQTNGRGRFSRKWYSPAKTGVWMSLIIRPNLSIAEAPRLTSLAAVAIAKALSALTGQRAMVKWPNDILFNGKKVCGILTDISAEGNHLQFVIVGIGINVQTSPGDSAIFPPDLQNKVCSLQDVAVKPIRRAEVVAGVLEVFETLYEAFIRDDNFVDILEYLRHNSATLGQVVEIVAGASKITGTAEDIDDYGALIVRLPDQQLKKIYSGDIHTIP